MKAICSTGQLDGVAEKLHDRIIMTNMRKETALDDFTLDAQSPVCIIDDLDFSVSARISSDSIVVPSYEALPAINYLFG
jgi:hypothetical protein